MVPAWEQSGRSLVNFPRIRGDGPTWMVELDWEDGFSPYSRGWSPNISSKHNGLSIFPVFAGMVPGSKRSKSSNTHFPRIRGDGPAPHQTWGTVNTFSPYSRGWSRRGRLNCIILFIFPVFAGMVHRRCLETPWITKFSPYSRGWSPTLAEDHAADIIFPVFAGMVPAHHADSRLAPDFPRIRGDGPGWVA